MREPEVAPCPAGGELENMIIIMKKENAIQTFYDDTLKHLDPFATLSSGLEGKYLCYGGGVKPLQRGKSFAVAEQGRRTAAKDDCLPSCRQCTARPSK